MPAAQLAALIYNVNRGKNVSSKSISDFLVFRRALAPEQDGGDIDAQLLSGNW